MPNTQPSNAPQADAPHPSDDLTAAAVLSDDSAGQPVGGGGSSGTGTGQGGAASPNSPIDAQLPHDAGAAMAEAEARHLATGGSAPEPGHNSQ